jgi:hypothetical protein
MSVFTNAGPGSATQAKAYVAALLDLLGANDPRQVLKQTPSGLREAIGGLTRDQLGQPEVPGKWSMQQVLQHLADSELVWGFRVRMVLAHDRPQLAGYDQDLWADRLHYSESDPNQAIEDFSVLRAGNLRLVARASGDDLRRVSVHAERGEESIEHMIRLNAGHDLLHLRQLDRIRLAIA